MATESEVIHLHEQLASTMTRMVEHARAGRWDQLPGLDGQCTFIVDCLKGLGPLEQLSGKDRAHIEGLMNRIRADQDELSGLIRPQLARLMQKIEQLQRTQDLDRAYGPSS